MRQGWGPRFAAAREAPHAGRRASSAAVRFLRVAEPDRELSGRLVMAVEPGPLVAHHAALLQLDHSPAHLVHHLAVVGGDHHGCAPAPDTGEQLHYPPLGLRGYGTGPLVRQP